MDQVYVDAVGKHFDVVKPYWERTTPTFIVKAPGEGYREYLMKPAFKALADELRGTPYMPRIRWIVDNYHLSILNRPPEGEEDYTRNKLLFGATVLTVLLDGFLRSNNPILTRELMPGVPAILNALVFTIAILIIFGVHEYGHKYIANRRGINASQPYFIPAPPGMGGTLGAVISQREPPVNRDALFDLGLAGPLAGFLVTILVGLLGVSLSFIVLNTQPTMWMIEYSNIRFQITPQPLILELIINVIKPTMENEVLILHPVAFAAWVGCIVTSINLMPSWQLDGGHVVRALVGRESHKIISIAGVLILVISGYMFMGVLVAFFMMRPGTESVEPLDDLSSLSVSRRLGIILYVVIILLSLVSLIPI
jgi:membrane-associated protease RseP (regulator of RpoE activity)